MRRLLGFLLLLLLLPAVVSAEDLPDSAQKILDSPGISAEQFQAISIPQLLEQLLGTAKEQFQQPFQLLTAISATVLIAAAALSLLPGSDWRTPLETVCLLGICVTALQPVLPLLEDLTCRIQECQTYLLSFVPVFSGVMISCGQPTQAAVYSGMFLTMAAFCAQIISAVAMPLVRAFLALNVACGLCDLGGLSDGCAVLHRAVKWILGFLSILFGGILGLQSILAQNTDTLAMKTGQFLLSSGVPVIGSLASDAMGSVLSGLRVLKGSLGFAAIAMLTITFLPLLIRCFGFYLAYLLGAALAKAFGLTRAGRVMNGLGQAIGLCISFLVFFFMLTVLSTALMILLGGGS
ncbi:stage III sporulation protein AE [Allofournierella massiliensis]|uniref:Stage III sporulation protein AE n=1 Tax=Allofournierella massiliensis TaxID=1650663 RepID=A0A4R1R0F7_9FIRM|nr:hypothetical protein [Fournierella massiliensis]TCL58762.1 stage III sporulation protein AE [Fournierella massiliensis]